MDRSVRIPEGVIEDVPITVGKCVIPTDFVVMKMKKGKKLPLLLGTDFLNTTGATMDFNKKRVVLTKVNDKVFYPMKSSSINTCGTITSDLNLEE
ncbi:hypothetical protein U6M95_12430 [Cutibacterium acnes]